MTTEKIFPTIDDDEVLVPYGPGAILQTYRADPDWRAAEVALGLIYLNMAPGATRAQLTLDAKPFSEYDWPTSVSIELTTGDMVSLRDTLDSLITAARQDDGDD